MADAHSKMWLAAVMLWALSLFCCMLLTYWVGHACFWSHEQLKRQNKKIMALNWVAIILFTVTTCILSGIAVFAVVNFYNRVENDNSIKFHWFSEAFSFVRADTTVAIIFYGVAKYALFSHYICD